VALSIGARLGPYEVVSALGAGGMGEVYKARDMRLDRTVAIKVLPSDVAGDPNLRARFEREAHAVAALDHPHICSIYDVGETNGTLYLVMPHLDGQTLAARLEKGPLPLDQALKIAAEIADALSSAHRHDIIHRDLKPANIMLTKAGAKILDFGLAKARKSGPISMSGMTRLSSRVPETAQGMILGTVQYMAPEQVEGKDADARSDIWALGAVIYEMTTGTRPFQGSTPASVIGAILKDDPRPVSSFQPLTPAMLDRLVARCFEKDPDARWQSAADVQLMLKWVRDGVLVSTPSAPPRSTARLRLWVPLAVAGMLLIGVLTLLPGWWAHRREAPPDVVQLSMLSPAGTAFSGPPSSIGASQIAISPDGRHIAFVAQARRGRPSLWVRSLADAEARLLRETDDAVYPFWSPDSRSLGFFAQGKLKTIDVAGGPPRTLSDAPLDTRGGTWGRDGTILFSPMANSGIFRISATGGAASQLTKLDASRGENSHRFPAFLPDGHHFLYTTRSASHENWGVSIADLESVVGIPLIERTEWSAQLAPPDSILFLRAGMLMSQPFDLSRLAMNGEATAIAADVGGTTVGYAAFSASHTGVIVHAGQIGLVGELRWFDRSGQPAESVGSPAEYLDFELSPDERTIAVSRVDPKLKAADIWLIDPGRSVQEQVTRDPTNDASPIWSPDGGRIVFRSNRTGNTALYHKRSSGTEAEHLVLDTGGNVTGSDWSFDGKTIVYTATASASGGFEIWVWSTDGKAKPQPAVRTALNAMHGRLSPNGRWLAYASDEFGELQVYIQPFPATGQKRQISADGGSEPRWRRDGNELFYLASSNKLMSVPLPGGNAFNAGVPKILFETHVPLTGNPYRSNYAVSHDGQRFLINTRIEDAPSPINIMLNWRPLLNR
jgi:serine/threonine protein kinase